MSKVSISKVVSFLGSHSINEASVRFKLSVGCLYNVLVAAAERPRCRSKIADLLLM